MAESRLHQIRPGEKLPNDWYDGRIPDNIQVGNNCLIDSTFVFEKFQSTQNPGLILGDHLTLWRASLACEAQGVIQIGSYCYLSNAAVLCSSSITLGDYVFLAGGVTVADSDFHPLDPASRMADAIAISPVGNRHQRPAIEAKPVCIGNDVWVGYNATILKGVTIGDGAMIAPGSVVLNDVAAGTQVAGNPAQPA